MNPLAVVAAVALLAANGVFVAAEFALLAARRSRLEELAAAGRRTAEHALAATSELSLMLAAAQLGITMATLGLGAVAEPAVERGLFALVGRLPLPSGVTHAIALVMALAIVVFLHMVVGEMAPKSWAISAPERAALLLARPFRGFAWLVRPFIRLLNAAANGVVRLTGVTPRDTLAATHSPADLLLLVTESARYGTLDVEQSELLTRALDLSGLDAEAAMVPRGDVVGVPADATTEALEEVARTTGRSRLVVYDGELDRVRGVLHVKDLLSVPDADRAQVTAADMARPVFATPESRPLESLMLDMQRERAHVAIVVDEFGSVVGIVTLEDVLEELIGEFEDEFDILTPGVDDEELPRRADGALLVPGGLRPDELADRTGLELPDGDWETVAGYVIATLGRLAQVGDAVPGPEGSRFTVTKMDGHRVAEVALHAVRP